MTQEERIKAEYERLFELFKELDANELAVATGLIQEAAFMSVVLEDLRESIRINGVTDEYQNGANQHGIKESAELKSYNAIIKNYKAVIDKLLRMVPHVKEEKPLSYTEILRIERARKAKESEEALSYIDSVTENASPELIESIQQCKFDASFDLVETVKLMKERELC